MGLQKVWSKRSIFLTQHIKIVYFFLYVLYSSLKCKAAFYSNINTSRVATVYSCVFYLIQQWSSFGIEICHCRWKITLDTTITILGNNNH